MPHDGSDRFNAGVTFPNLAWQIITLVVYVITLSWVAGLGARRLKLFTNVLRHVQVLSSPWICDFLVLGVYLVSYIFIVINGVLTYAIGTAHNEHTCDGSVTVCVTIFVVSKVLLYFFYLERLQMLNNGSPPRFMKRFRDKQWLCGAAIFSLGVPAAILLGFSRKFKLVYVEGTTEAVGCAVGLIPGYAVPVIVWCGVINIYYLATYWIASRQIPEQRGLARRCLVAIAVSAISTCINLSVLVLLKFEHGIECGTICCGIDVTVNVFALSLVTSAKGEEVQLFGSREKSPGPSTPLSPMGDFKGVA